MNPIFFHLNKLRLTSLRIIEADFRKIEGQLEENRGKCWPNFFPDLTFLNPWDRESIFANGP